MVYFLPEPMAVSFAHFNVLIFDLGNTALNISVFNVEHNHLKVAVTHNHEAVEGKAFTLALYNYFAKKL